MPRHYLDHASTSPLRPSALEAMMPWLGAAADPGRVHTEGRMARIAIEEARQQVADLLGARAREVVFTSGTTEGANAAVWGATGRHPDGVIALAMVEHACVRDSSARHPTVTVPVDERGRLSVDAVRRLLANEPVALVHCQWANHEVGTLQPVEAIVAACRDAGVLVHVDAAQAVGHVAVAFDDLGADLLSFSGHKFGAPGGIGALLVRRGLRLDPILVGGDQERARRAGMENVAAIVGLGAVAGELSADGEQLLRHEAAQAHIRSERLRAGLMAVDGVLTYGDPDPAGRVPQLICVGVRDVEAEAVLLGLDQAGIAAHSGSACSSESLEPSPVLQAMGIDEQRSLRLSVGWNSADGDVDAALAVFPGVIRRLRALGSS